MALGGNYACPIVFRQADHATPALIRKVRTVSVYTSRALVIALLFKQGAEQPSGNRQAASLPHDLLTPAEHF